MGKERAEYNIIERHFSSIYLTVIALIQGIALSTLANTLFEDLRKSTFTDAEQYTMVIITIFITWHHYMYGIIYSRWFPGIIDTLLPLFIGVCQFIISASIHNPSLWLMFLSGFFLSGGLAYLNAALRIRSSLFSTHFDDEYAELYCSRIRICHSVAGLFSIFMSIFIFVISINCLNYNWIYLAIAFSLTHIIAYEVYYLKKIKPLYLLKDKGTP